MEQCGHNEREETLTNSYNEAVVAAKFAKRLNRLDAIKDCDIFRYFVQNAIGKNAQEMATVCV